LLTFNIPVTLHGLLGTPGNQELRKRRDVAILAFNDVGLTSLMGDVNAGHAHDATRNSPVCIGHAWGVRRDLRVDLRGDPMVLPCHPKALGAKREETKK